MATYTLVVHSGDTPFPPFEVDLDPSQQLIRLSLLIGPMADSIRKTSNSKRGIAWRYMVRRENGSWDELDFMQSPEHQRLPAGATIHIFDITENLRSSD